MPVRTMVISTVASLATLLSCSRDKESNPKPSSAEKQNLSKLISGEANRDTTLAGKYFSQAEQMAKKAKYDSASIYFELASRQFGNKGGWSNYLRSRNQMGKCVIEAGQYDRAGQILSEALVVGIEHLGQDALEVAETYNYLGHNHWRQGEMDNAEELHKKALEIQLAKVSEQHPDVALSYLYLGEVYQRRNELDKAFAFHSLALKILLKTFGEQHERVAEVYNTIGGDYWFKGDSETALEFISKALSIWQETLGEQHPKTAIGIGNIAIMFAEKGDYDKAIQFFEKSLSLKIAKLGEDHAHVANEYGNLAFCYQFKGDFQQALVLGKKSTSIWMKKFNIGHPEVANHVTNLGVTYRHLGQYEEAIKCHQQALAGLLSSVGERHFYVIATHNFLGQTHLEMGDTLQAIASFEQALRIGKATFGEFHPEIAATCNILAEIYAGSRQFDRALDFCQQAIKANIPTLLLDDPYKDPPLIGVLSEPHLLTSLEHKAKILMARYHSSQRMRDFDSGVATYLLASRLIDKMRSGYKAEGSKLFLAGQATDVYNAGIMAARELFHVTQEKQHLETAFQFAEKSKAVILLDAFTDAEARKFAKIPDNLLKRERQLRVDLAFYERNLTEEQTRGGDADSNKIAAWQDKLFDLNQDYEALLQRFEQEYPDYYNLKYQINTASVQQVQEQILDENTALVEYFTGKDSIFIFTITPNDFDVTAAAKSPLFEQQIEQLRNGILEKDFSKYTKAAHLLYQILLEPIADGLEAQNLIIVPDGAISAIPFEGLLTQAVEVESREYSQLPYLVNDHALSHAYSATLLLETLRRHRTRNKRDYLAFAPVFPEGLPAYTRGAEFFEESLTLDSTQTATRIRGYLPASKKEVEDIFTVFDNSYGFVERLFNRKSQIYLEREAREDVIKSPALKEYRYLHFATHGFVSETTPKLSGLLLAQDTTSTEDGILYLGEIYNLDLNADLVTLSACETGLGQIAKGEGIIGLTRGFLYAGASNLLVSLWQVSDASTAELMVEFYSGVLQGQSKAQALQAAKLELMSRNPEYAKPYYWAPFVLIGK